MWFQINYIYAQTEMIKSPDNSFTSLSWLKEMAESLPCDFSYFEWDNC